ncbi:DNA-deoxyinosine glycosylase [Ornithinibacillus salinisoli]|uniref:DNA-deoxyinosine glycosylase n=1 Tax=Ornithinibacillus salinisoli TaxID=1848459 RepID=A0ABW4VUC1_9BACI
MSEKLIGLAPVISDQPRVLILGSMPSKQSLEKQEYYGNPRNHFWKIMMNILEHDTPILNYEDKLALIKHHHIALWDTINACYREGSLDADIIAEEPNDLDQLIKDFPSIRLIACNGTKSFQTFNKYFEKENFLNVDVIKLPSSSPVPGRYNKTLDGKIADWQQITTYL